MTDTKIVREKIRVLKATTPDLFQENVDSESGVMDPATPDESDQEKLRVFLSKVSKLAMFLRGKAFQWSIGAGSGASHNFAVRIAMVNVVVAGSEMGNQLETRADTLLKQMKGKGRGLDRRELPPSVALRDAEPTDFVHLYKWLDATSHSFLAEYIQGIGSVETRVKIIERLFSDHYWSKINTVYASGRGRVSMAFIKDDVGNWNLKSFDNDPAELLQAYTDFSIEALKKATELAAAGSSGGGSAVTDLAINQLVGLANQSAFNSGSASGKSEVKGMLRGLHSSLMAQLIQKEKEWEANPEKDHKALLIEIKGLLQTHSNIVDNLAKGLLHESDKEANALPANLSKPEIADLQLNKEANALPAKLSKPKIADLSGP